MIVGSLKKAFRQTETGLTVSPNSRVSGFQGLVSRTVSSLCENPTRVFSSSWGTREKQSYDLFPVTHHSGIFGPVHTGSGYILKVCCAPRHQRRRELCSHTTASVPFRCAPPSVPFVRGRPPANVVALPSSGSTWSTLRRVLHRLGPRPGFPPRRSRVSSGSSSHTWVTLQRPFHHPGLPGGFQAAITGNEEASRYKVYSFLIVGRQLVENLHVVVALRRPLSKCWNGGEVRKWL